jgi:hypothetical protein
LTNGDAVRSRVIAEMNRLISRSQPGDLAIVAYSGHGMRVRSYPQWAGLDASGGQTQIALSRFSNHTSETAHEIIVDREMRAWLTRLDAKGVDVLVVMDACFGGAMRDIAPFAPGMKVRSLPGDINDAIHDSFVGIPMSQREARADVKELSHVTFFAGATAESVVPEWPGIDRSNPKGVRGALSFFAARAFEGLPWRSGNVTREQLYKFLTPNVRQVTDQIQILAFEPRSASPEAQRKTVFRLGDDSAPEAPGAASDLKPPPEPPVDPVRVAITNGSPAELASIEKRHAPFVRAEPADAELVWNVGSSTAVSRSDTIMTGVDGTMLGEVIDRTWAVREIQKLSRSRVLDMKMREEGKAYRIGDRPELLIDDVRGRYLTVVNIAADGTVQMLFPVYADQDPHILTDHWRYAPIVEEPLGTDVVVAVVTSRPAAELITWLKTHNLKRDGFELPHAIARTIAADAEARVGALGLYTTP